MLVPGIPFAIVRARSSSVGAVPDGTLVILYRAAVKSRGAAPLNASAVAAGPLPSPRSPWQRAHQRP
jgi:hypothetical protein